MREKPAFDLSGLGTYGFGSASPMWWGTLAFVVLEGTGFVLGAGAYLYLFTLNPDWPLGVSPPDHWPGTIVLALLIASVIPNHFASRWAGEQKVLKVRIAMIAMSVFGLLPLIVRGFEFPALDVRWDDNAYGSILWFLLGLHTAHLITDLGDTLVLTALMFTRHGNKPRRFSDVIDNAFYWDFVVASWIPLYILIYWVPRF
jgi:cytochrome c oxidase subunit III